ncbi:unnamed protein product [Toxocara canis]|uniref:Smoothelin domain-containing protein n=1 Tax=Toxocara canis TaxID=6265 RepID=A0A183UP85_TOXCA|nr:unnamed protein product [Toxocara canis]
MIRRDVGVAEAEEIRKDVEMRYQLGTIQERLRGALRRASGQK